MRRRPLAAIVLVAVLTGCGSPADESSPRSAGPDADPPAVPPASTHTAAPPATEAPEPAPSPDPAAPGGEDVLEEYPELDVAPWEETADDALATAAAAVATYLDPASPTWWPDLAALLSPAAETVYGSVDPTVIPAGDLTGDPVAVQTDAGGLLATVRVPTSVGDIDVLLTRATADVGGWEVEQINPAGTP